MTTAEFQLLRQKIHLLCGIAIPEEKRYLIQQRLGPLCTEHGCTSFSELLRILSRDDAGELSQRVVVAIATNETFFFRDGHPFETFSTQLLPRIIDAWRMRRAAGKGPERMRLWSAASSTGQEVYSLAICIREYLKQNPGLHPDLFELVATDISSTALSQAMRGAYTQMEIARGLDPALRERYFRQNGTHWVAVDELHDMIEFRHLNLMEPFAHLGQFDAIFCRNVLIYFDDESRQRVLASMAGMLPQAGFLMLGSTENLYGTETPLHAERLERTLIYTRTGKPTAVIPKAAILQQQRPALESKPRETGKSTRIKRVGK